MTRSVINRRFRHFIDSGFRHIVYIRYEIAVEWMVHHSCFAAKYEQFHTCSCHCHIHSPDVGKEAYFAIFIGTDKADKDDVALLSLKTVDSIDCYLHQERMQCFHLFDTAAKILGLHFVGRDYANVNSFIKKTFFANLIYILHKCFKHQVSLCFVYAPVVISDILFSENVCVLRVNHQYSVPTIYQRVSRTSIFE